MTTTLYCVVDDVGNTLCGCFLTYADAEEFLYALLEEWCYEVMMTEDPVDVLGKREWDWYEDYWWLMTDAWRTFYITTTKCIDIR